MGNVKKDVHAMLDANSARRAWAEVEIFLRVKGRLPTKEGDTLTADICEEFIDKFLDHPVHSKWAGDAFEILSEKKKD